MAKRNRASKVIGWILLILGLAAVFIPHIGFLANLIPSLDVISHSVLEIAAAVSIIIAFTLLCKKRRR